jgi:DNA-binding NarL/FixJ family response regulator
LPIQVLGSSPIEVELLRRALSDEVVGPAAADGEEPTVVVLVRPGPAEWSRATGLAPARVIVVDDAGSDAAVVELVSRGADGVVDLAEPMAKVVDLVAADDGQGPALSDDQVRAVVEALRASTVPAAERDRLTERELEVLRCIDGGMSVKQTARALAISAKTVENLQSRMFRKLGARNRAQAVLVGHRIGVLGEEPGGSVEVSA